jgi:N-acetylmuramoyl-L-alanine amidase
MKIALDAGHGMSNAKPGVFDTGADIPGPLDEAGIALQWVLTLKHALTEAGIDVHLIRTGTTDPSPVGSRAREAQEAGCTHFLSVHCDSTPGATGTTTIYRPGSGDLAWAKLVHGCAVGALGLRDRGVKDESATKRKRLAVLSFDGPACLVELGFIDTPGDLARMVDRERRIDFARRLVERIRPE